MSETRLFVLEVQADPGTRGVAIRLCHEHGQLIAEKHINVGDHPLSIWDELLDTARFMRRRARTVTPSGDADFFSNDAEAVEQIGVFLGKEVFGPAAMQALCEGEDRRSLVIRFPKAGLDPLTSALACVPFHLARPAPGERSLMERNVVVRIAPPGIPPGHISGRTTVPRDPSEPLRVLLVFVEAPGARPLLSRREREELRALFYDEIMPERQVMLDILCHGISRDRLRHKLQDAGGYHVIYWSGHGHDLGPDPALAGEVVDLLRGSDLSEVIAEAGGFVPELVVLSASHSGRLGNVFSWDALKAQLIDESVSDCEKIPGKELTFAQILDRHIGCSETALELARLGVPQIVLMRHPTSGDYARELFLGFFRLLLGAEQQKAADNALSLAQRELWSKPDANRFSPFDHSAVMMFGEEPKRFDIERGPSPDLELRRPQPQPLLRGRSDLDPPSRFAGRVSELSSLAVGWLPKRGAAVALLYGAEGVGKTWLAAETIHLWHRQFHWVIALSAQSTGLSIDDFLREIDKRLMRASPMYRERCKENEERRIFLPARQDLTGPERYELLRDNLIDVLSTSSGLIVADGFEINLGTVPIETGHLCSDPEWETLLQTFVSRLADVTGSRILLTSRLPIASLSGSGSSEVVALELSALPVNEALSLAEASEPLRRLLWGAREERRLAWRVLESSKGHPTTLLRLASLAQEGVSALEDVLKASAPDTSVNTGQYVLPAAGAQQVSERAALLLLEKLTPEQRSLLWKLSRAPAPVQSSVLQQMKEIAP